MRVQLVSRDGCHLCEDAEQLLHHRAIPFERLNVDARPDLLAEYDMRVPVLLVDGTPAAEGRIEDQALSAALAR
ncbi:MAG: glutaredoxin family protein [Candidatus Dormibacteraeota bacterium]|nr:glutaredoxin family protein [Candidatus Dormibacteraeota bacterium]MBO0762306.1 glutaredoxin family protein [Candidatus Dormibacteraeota bacterium]